MFDRLFRLLAGDTPKLHAWLNEPGWRWPGVCCAAVFLGSGVYGATLGLWRDGLQAFYTALKFPLLVFLTCGANAALNGCLGQLLGSGLGFRQTTLAILMGFAVTAIALQTSGSTAAAQKIFLGWHAAPAALGRGARVRAAAALEIRRDRVGRSEQPPRDMDGDLRARVPADDDGRAPHRRHVAAFPAAGKTIFPGPLVAGAGQPLGWP